MTKELINETIAKLNGFSFHLDYDPCREGYWRNPNGEIISNDLLPNYYEDLNEMHKLECDSNFFTNHGEEYVKQLATIVLGGDDLSIWESRYCLVSANSKQKSEAYLKTLNEWIE